MKVTQKATVALGQHQIMARGMYQTGTESGGSVTCECGETMFFNYADLPHDALDASPYLYGLMAAHQIEKMEEA